jgi:uncharacterized protein DUF2752
MKSHKAQAAILAVAAAVGCWVLYRWVPAEVNWYPGCLFAGLTGLYCPGCGTLRAIHALLHGNLAGAFGYNPLFTAALPVMAVAAVGRFIKLTRSGRIGEYRWASRVAFPMLGVVTVFAVLRNLPFEQLRWMAP